MDADYKGFRIVTKNDIRDIIEIVKRKLEQLPVPSGDINSSKSPSDIFSKALSRYSIQRAGQLNLEEFTEVFKSGLEISLPNDGDIESLF